MYNISDYDKSVAPTFDLIIDLTCPVYEILHIVC